MTWYWPDWYSSQPPQPPQPDENRRCQHCASSIYRILGTDTWADGRGISVCKKRVGDESFLLHQPMPVITTNTEGSAA